MSFLVNENDNLNDLFPPIPLSSGGHILGADDQQLLSNLTVDLEIMNSTTCEVTDTSTSSSSLFKTHNERYEALIARNPAANGQFLYCVTSTKIVCRPSCPSRRPRRNGVIFVDTLNEALSMGFRVCKRCTPETVDAVEYKQLRLIKQMKSIMLQEPAKYNLEVIAERLNTSKYHLHRTFKARVGCTPLVWLKNHLQS